MHGPPTIANHLALIEQPITHSAVAHTALVTFALVDTSGGLTAQEIVNNFQSAFGLRLAPEMDDSVTIQKPTVQLGDGTSTPSIATGAGDTNVGTNAMSAPPPNTCALVKKLTSLGGRHNRGRTYLPWCVAEGNIDEAGNIAGSVMSGLQGQLDLFTSDLVAGGVPMVIANRTYAVDGTTGKRYVSAYTTGPLVTQYNLEGKVATQRRRMPR